MNIDPLAPDAPIIALLSLRDNPLVADMTEAELGQLITRLTTLARQAPTLNSAILTESTKIKEKRSPVAAKRKALLDSL